MRMPAAAPLCTERRSEVRFRLRYVAASTARPFGRQGHGRFTEIADAVRKQQTIGIRFVGSFQLTPENAGNGHGPAHEQSWRGTCVDPAAQCRSPRAAGAQAGGFEPPGDLHRLPIISRAP